MLYFTILSICILLASTIRNNGELVLHSFVAILILISGFRSVYVGTDTINYKMYFDVIASGEYLPIEIGWLAINNFVALLNGSFETLLLFIALLTLLPIYYITKKSSVNPMFSLFLYFTLYFYFYSFNISRQLLAVSFVLLSYYQLKNNNKLFFILFVFLAASFHSSALIALPLIFVNKIPVNNRFYIIGIIITAFIGLFGTDFIYDSVKVTSYGKYLDQFELGLIPGNALYLLILNGFFLFTLFNSSDRETYFKIFYVFILVSNLITRIPFGNRVTMYFAIIQILYLPLFIYSSNKNNKLLLTSVVILYAFIIYFKTFGAGEVIPYSNSLLFD